MSRSVHAGVPRSQGRHGKAKKISLRFTSQIWEDKMMDVLTDGPAGECWTPNI